jgi:hypothetical protein
MTQQNINQYNFKKWYVKSVPRLFDVSIASDEKSFNEEVALSPYIIGENDGNVLPIYFDLDSYYCNQKLDLNYGTFNSGNTLISKNYYNPNNENLYLITAQTLCDIGLTGIDNGLVPEMTGMTISYTNGLTNSALAFDRYTFDRRLKLFQVTGYTNSPNVRFSANTAQTVYEVVSKNSNIFGEYHHLYGGFYQGFFQLFGYDYEAFPNRTNKGWSVEMILKARQQNQYSPEPGQVTLNDVYPDNSNIFFYFGARAENKFYYNDSSLTGITSCSCSETGNTNSRCVDVYTQTTKFNPSEVVLTASTAGTFSMSVSGTPLLDSMSNNFALRLKGDMSNPNVCVKVLKLTAQTIVETVTATTTVDGILPCETDLTKILSGYTIEEYCSTNKIFDYCAEENPDYLNKEHWFQVDCIWERNNFYDDADIEKFGGLGSITNDTYVLPDLELINTSGKTPGYCDQSVTVLGINEAWIVEKDFRLGSLKIYINGRLFFVINGFEEVIPRALHTEKEKQIGAPFNISWGGGTQGLRESLSFSAGTTDYVQVPQVMPDWLLENSSYSGLTTDILLEPTFAGTFDGAISQFRMYTKPISYPEVVHNFELNVNKFNMFNHRCPSCDDTLVNDISFTVSDNTIIFDSELLSGYTFDFSALPNGEIYRVGQSENNEFPYSYSPTNDGNGTYYFYFPDIDQTLSLYIDTITGVDLDITVDFEPGSVIANYTVVSDIVFPINFDVTFSGSINTISGITYTGTSVLNIPPGSFSASTTQVYDVDYNLFNGEFGLNLSGFNQTGDTKLIFEVIPPTPSQTRTPTPTPTATNTPTPSITPTTTSNPTPTATPTPTVTPSSTSTPLDLVRALYINDFNTIIGNNTEEITLYNFIQSQGFNTIYCYDLNGILSTSSGRTAVRAFNTNVRYYGVDIIGGIGGSSNSLISSLSNSRLSYNTGCTTNSQKYDYFNLENEFWNYPNAGTVQFNTWKVYVNQVNQTISGTTTKFDTYIGQIEDPTSANTQSQVSDFLVGNLDRILLACYLTTNQFTGSTNYGFNRIVDELTLIGDSAISASTVADVAIIYHGGSSYMNSYFQNNTFETAYNNFLSVYNSWSGTSKNGINLIGYTIYGYQQVKNLIPPTPTPTPTPTLTPTNTKTPTPSVTNTITPTSTKTPTPTTDSIQLRTYYGIWSDFSNISTCNPILSGLTISTANTLTNGVVVRYLNGELINNLTVNYTTTADTFNFTTNSIGVITALNYCEGQPTPTVCSGNQFTITNNTNTPISIGNVTSPYTNVTIPVFSMPAYTILIVSSCDTPTPITTPTPTPSVTNTITPTSTKTPTPTVTQTMTSTNTPTPTPTQTTTSLGPCGILNTSFTGFTVDSGINYTIKAVNEPVSATIQYWVGGNFDTKSNDYLAIIDNDNRILNVLDRYPVGGSVLSISQDSTTNDVYVAGEFTGFDSRPNYGSLGRYLSDGLGGWTFDSSFNIFGPIISGNSISKVEIYNDEIYVALNRIGTTSRLLKYDTSGNVLMGIDLEYSGTNRTFSDFVINPTYNQLVFVGDFLDFTDGNGDLCGGRGYACIYLDTFIIDPSFTGSTPYNPTTIIADSDGNYLMGGAFGAGWPYQYVKFDNTGTIDNTFGTYYVSGNTAQINKVLQLSSGDYLIAGDFNIYNGAGTGGWFVVNNTTGADNNRYNTSQGDTSIYVIESQNNIIFVGDISFTNGGVSRINMFSLNQPCRQ